MNLFYFLTTNVGSYIKFNSHDWGRIAKNSIHTSFQRVACCCWLGGRKKNPMNQTILPFQLVVENNDNLLIVCVLVYGNKDNVRFYINWMWYELWFVYRWDNLRSMKQTWTDCYACKLELFWMPAVKFVQVVEVKFSNYMTRKWQPVIEGFGSVWWWY